MKCEIRVDFVEEFFIKIQVQLQFLLQPKVTDVKAFNYQLCFRDLELL